MTVLRAGLIGLGQMGRNHVRVLRSLEGVDLVAALDPAGDPSGVATGTPVVETIEALLAHGLDCCVVASPTRFHLEGGMALAEAGVHTPLPDTTNMLGCLQFASRSTLSHQYRPPASGGAIAPVL